MAKIKGLPSHTKRYFAEQAYRAIMCWGSKGPREYLTVQGVLLTVEYNRTFKQMTLTYVINGKTFCEAEPIRKGWM